MNYHRAKIPCYLYNVPSGISWKEHLLYEDVQTSILPYPSEFAGGNQLLGRHARPELRLRPFGESDANHGCRRNANPRLRCLWGARNRLPASGQPHPPHHREKRRPRAQHRLHLRAAQHTVSIGYGEDGRIATAGFLQGSTPQTFTWQYMEKKRLALRDGHAQRHDAGMGL